MNLVKKITSLLLSVILLLGLVSQTVFAEETITSPFEHEVKQDVIFLDTDKGDDSNDGTSLENSVKTLNKAKSLIKDNGTIKLFSQIKVTQDEVWDFSGLSNVKIERNTNGAMVSVEGNSTLRLKNVTLDGENQKGTTNDEVIEIGKVAGGKENGATLILDSGTVIENNKNYQRAGGAISAFSYNKIVMNEGAVIRNNEAQFGGAISLENHSVFEMNGGDIYNNIAVRGGAVSVIASDMVMNSGRINNNSANSTDKYLGHYGGAIYISNYGDWSNVGSDHSRDIAGKANFTMNGGSLSENSATYIQGSDIGLGGAIATYPRFDSGYEQTPEIVITINSGKITGNKAINGGAISAYFQATILKLTGGKIEENKANSQGGGIYSVFNSTTNISDTQINTNTASIGGGVYLHSSKFNMISGKINSNIATNQGGGIYLDPYVYNGACATATLTGGYVNGNVAESGKGSDGIYQGSVLNIGDSISIDKNNDVYLPIGKIINVVKPLTYINSINTVHITSEEKVVENDEKAGTKLVKYYDKAGGVQAAKQAELEQVYIRSKYMPKDLVIGKSEHDYQKDFMTYIAKSKYSVSYEFISGTKEKDLPQEVLDLLPSDTKEYLQGSKVSAIQPDKTSVSVTDGLWTFKGYDADEKEATSNLKFTGTWEFKLTVNEKPTTPDSKPKNKPSNQNQNISKPSNQNQNASKPINLPQTGDTTNHLGLLGLMFASSGSVLLGLNRKSQKKQR